MRRQKLLFLTELPYRGVIGGGVQSAVSSLAEGMSEYAGSHDITFASLNAQVEEDESTDIHGVKWVYLKSCSAAYQKPRFLWNVPRIRKYISETNPDVINVIDNPAMAIAALKSGRRTIFTIHGIKGVEAKVWKGEEYWTHQMEAFLEAGFHRKFKNFISISPYVDGILRNKFGNSKTIFQIPNAVSKDFLACGKNKTAGEKLRILNVGSFTRLKSQHILIEAIKQYGLSTEEVEVTFAGHVNDESYYRELTESASNNVCFIREASREQIIGLLNSHDVMIHTSMQENTPMVFLEAMAAGMPVISPDVGGVSELFDGEKYGTLYQYGDSERLSEMIREFRQKERTYAEKSESAKAFVNETFHPVKIAGRTIEAMLLIGNNEN